MQAPIKPPRESERLKELRSLKILDTAAEQTFDDLTALASVICGKPMALLTLVDSDRQWFKSKVGTCFTETPRDISFCGHAINERKIFELPDASLDARFADNPLVVKDPKLRFYAGAPLVTRAGHALGTLCVLDRQPSRLTDQQRSSLEALARQAVALLELREKSLRLEQELSQAKGREEELRALSEKLAFAQETARLGSWDLRIATNELSWSTELHRIFELDHPQTSDQLHQHFLTRVHPEDLPALQLLLKRAREQGEDFAKEHRLLLDRGARIKYVRSLAQVVRDEKGRPTLLRGICQDRTEEQDMRETIDRERSRSIQAAKLASLGEMSAGIAHEINNPLGIITGTIMVLPKFTQDPEKFKSRIETISQAAERITKIVSGLRKFSRTSVRLERRPVELRKLLDDVLVLTAPKARGKNVQVFIESTNEETLSCNEIEIEQVLLNIINNGIDAASRQTEKWVKISMTATLDSIRITVRDSGRGISKEAQAKLFQPFFTTKPIGEGTGLGLAISKGILDEHGATIGLVTDDAHTCFELVFPRAGGAEKNAV